MTQIQDSRSIQIMMLVILVFFSGENNKITAIPRRWCVLFVRLEQAIVLDNQLHMCIYIYIVYIYIYIIT